MRYHEIIEELSDYDPSVKAGAIMSTVTLGEIVELAKAADTIERLQEELERTKAATMPIDQLLIERDAALAEADERGESFARSIEDFNNMRDQRDAALDEVKRIQSERTFWHEKWRRDWQALNEARTEVERLKTELLEAMRGQMGDLEKRYEWGML